MELGAFSLSLTVKDLKVSRDFYAKLGFESTLGAGSMTFTDPDGNPILIDQFF